MPTNPQMTMNSNQLHIYKGENETPKKGRRNGRQSARYGEKGEDDHDRDRRTG